MSLVTADLNLTQPYPGLRSFNRDEVDLFFGRDDCIHALVDTLSRTRFLAVLGSSGTGKSSIVKTGLLDALDRGLLESAGARWRVIDFRPGGAPLRNLAKALLEATKKDKPTEVEINILRGFLKRGPRSVIEWCHDGNLPPKTNLLLLVDQFEELFRYQDYAGKEESEAFAALLIESAHSVEFPIYVAITMRSEYLGACSLIDGLAETISQGMVLTPRMSRDQCRLAIEGPSKVCGFTIEKPLVNQLLNDLANFAPWDEAGSSDQLDRLVRRADQLPLLQYTLNRLWLDALTPGSGEAVQLRLADYLRVGGLSGALDTHGNAILAELSKKGLAPAVEKIFQALVQGTSVADAVRRPRQFKDLVELCDSDVRAVEEVLYAFCAPGCNFLAPELRDPGVDKRPPIPNNQLIDISHESLIRQWRVMADWLHKENTSAQNWRRLNDRMADGESLRGRELANLLAWREEAKPTAAWAKRYGGDFAQAEAFLEKSRKAEEAARRRRYILIASGIVGEVVALGGVALYMGFKASEATGRLQAAYDNIAIANGKLKLQAESLEEQKEQLQRKTEQLIQQTEQYQKAYATMQAQYAAARKQRIADIGRALDLGPAPSSSGNYAGELTDNHVSPTGQLASILTAPTPISIPGGLVLTTRQVYDAIGQNHVTSLSGTSVRLVLIDVSDAKGPSLPTAHRVLGVGGGGKFDDTTQTRLFTVLATLAQNFGEGLVFFGADAKSWAPYNAALRALQMGYANVFWYRGGVAAWTAADLKTMP